MDLNKGKNINNAFYIVFETYRNVEKFMNEIRSIGKEKYNMTMASSRFIRYKSDNDIYGWAIDSFLLPFRKQRNRDTIYLVDIFFDYEPESERVNEGPQIGLSKIAYSKLGNDEELFTPSDYWYFNDLLLDDGKYVVYKSNEEQNIYQSTAITEKGSKKYENLISVKSVYIPLVDVDSKNIEEKIFGTFDELDRM